MHNPSHIHLRGTVRRIRNHEVAVNMDMKTVYDLIKSIEDNKMGITAVLDLDPDGPAAVVPLTDIFERDACTLNMFKDMNLEDPKSPVSQEYKARADGSMEILCYDSKSSGSKTSRDGCQGHGLVFKSVTFTEDISCDNLIRLKFSDMYNIEKSQRNVFISRSSSIDVYALQSFPKQFLFALHCSLFVHGDDFRRLKISEYWPEIMELRTHDLHIKPTYDERNQYSFCSGLLLCTSADRSANIKTCNEVVKIMEGAKAEAEAAADKAEAEAAAADKAEAEAAADKAEAEAAANKAAKAKAKIEKMIKACSENSDAMKFANKMISGFHQHWSSSESDERIYTTTLPEIGSTRIQVEFKFNNLELARVENVDKLPEHFENFFLGATQKDAASAFTYYTLILKKLKPLGLLDDKADLINLNETCNLWNYISSIQKTYIIDGERFEIPKLKLGFTKDGKSTNEIEEVFVRPFEYLTDRDEVTVKELVELVKFCQTLRKLVDDYGPMKSIPAYFTSQTNDETIILTIEFEGRNGFERRLMALRTSVKQRDILFQGRDLFIQVIKEHHGKRSVEPNVVNFIGNGYEAVKELVDIEQSNAKLFFKVSDINEDNNEYHCSLILGSKEYTSFLNLRRMKNTGKKRDQPEPPPYATEEYVTEEELDEKDKRSGNRRRV